MEDSSSVVEDPLVVPVKPVLDVSVEDVVSVPVVVGTLGSVGAVVLPPVEVASPVLALLSEPAPGGSLKQPPRYNARNGVQRIGRNIRMTKGTASGRAVKARGAPCVGTGAVRLPA